MTEKKCIKVHGSSTGYYCQLSEGHNGGCRFLWQGEGPEPNYMGRPLPHERWIEPEALYERLDQLELSYKWLEARAQADGFVVLSEVQEALAGKVPKNFRAKVMR
jgi:hypothetical protein